ncbi:MAG: hypothetical protein U5K54_07880 [Cytophagales bacterium]|nr:hypothetical protein [Cytophagales bacterium]
MSAESNLSAITSTTTLTLFAFLGLECATIPAGNVKESGTTTQERQLLGLY